MIRLVVLLAVLAGCKNQPVDAAALKNDSAPPPAAASGSAVSQAVDYEPTHPEDAVRRLYGNQADENKDTVYKTTGSTLAPQAELRSAAGSLPAQTAGLELTANEDRLVYVSCTCNFSCRITRNGGEQQTGEGRARAELGTGTVTAWTILRGGASIQNTEGLRLVGNITQVLLSGNLDSLLTVRAGQACREAIGAMRWQHDNCGRAARGALGDNDLGGLTRTNTSAAWDMGSTWVPVVGANRRAEGRCAATVEGLP